MKKRPIKNNNKSISNIIALMLLVFVVVLSVTIFNIWFTDYYSNILSITEQNSLIKSKPTIETVIGNTLYIKNSGSNVTIKQIQIDGINCNIDQATYSTAIFEIDLNECLKNITSLNPEIVVITDKEVLEKKIYVKNTLKSNCVLNGFVVTHGLSDFFYNSLNGTNGSCDSIIRTCNNGILSGNDSYIYRSCTSDCYIDNMTTVLNGNNMLFYLSEFSVSGCVNETRVCNNGVLNGSYNYTSCSTELAFGGDYIEDFSIGETNYRAHIFSTTGNSTFTVVKDNLEIDYLIVAGGGGGGGCFTGAGGGAGGFIESNTVLSKGNVSISVGLGGTGGAGGNHDNYMWRSKPGNNGNDSSIGSIIAYGGGGGGSFL